MDIPLNLLSHIPKFRHQLILELVFFLLIRHSNEWVNYFIIERQKLHDYVDLNNVGSKNSKLNTVQLYVSFNEKLKSAKCSKNDFSFHIKDWSKFR